VGGRPSRLTHRIDRDPCQQLSQRIADGDDTINNPIRGHRKTANAREEQTRCKQEIKRGEDGRKGGLK